MLPNNVCFEKYNKKIDHRACLRGIMGPTYSIYTCNHARHFIASRYVLLQLEARVFKVALEKNLMGRKSRGYGTI